MPFRKVLADLSRGVWPPSSGKKNHKNLFCHQGANSFSLQGRHIYYEPPEDFEWSADSALLPTSKIASGAEIIVHCRESSPLRKSKPEPSTPSTDCCLQSEQKTEENRAYTQEEFTSAILARTQSAVSTERKDIPTTLPPSAEIPSGNAPSLDCLVSENPTQTEENKTEVGEDKLSESSTMGENCLSQACRKSSDSPNHKCECEKRLSNGQHDADCKRDSRNSDYAGSPVLERRNKSVLGRLKNFTARSSYSANEDGHSHSSDYEDQEEEKKADIRFSREAKERTSSSWTVRVRHLHRDVKRKISRLRNSRGTAPEDENRDSIEVPENVIRTGSSVESIPSGSGSSLQPPTPTSSNRSSTSAGEDESSPYVGTFIGRARALVDCTPSPYDRDGLAFKKGDIIDIIAKHKTGIWVGMANGKVGHFKFINVEDIQEERKPRRRRKKNAPNWLSSTKKPETLEQLLSQLGLQEYMNVFVLNGYGELDTFKEIEKSDLEGLGIVNPEHGLKLLRAAEMFQSADFDVEEGEEEEQMVQSPRDSGCYASHENLNHKDSSQRAFQSGQFVADGEDIDTSHSESGIHSREGQDISLTMNNLDVSAESSTKSTTTTVDSREDVAVAMDTTSEDKGLAIYNIPPSQELIYNRANSFSDSVVTVNNYPLDDIGQSTEDIQSDFVPVTTFANSISSAAFSPVLARSNTSVTGSLPALTNGYKGGTTKSRNKHSRNKLSSHKGKKESSSTHFSYCSKTLDTNDGRQVPEIYVDRASYIYGWASFSKKEKPPRRQVQEYDDVVSDPAAEPDISPGRFVYRRAKQRKGSLQALVHCPRPPSPTLLGIVRQKLENERIDLCTEPYSDKTGFCGIPPALVQRYAEELQQNLTDVADALDQIRITALQQQARRGVPNDFLADSCTIPVIEANYTNLHSWLISLGLPMYEDLLNSCGFSYLEQVAALSIQDLADMGVHDPYHQLYLEDAISALQSRFGVRLSQSSVNPSLPVSTTS